MINRCDENPCCGDQTYCTRTYKEAIPHADATEQPLGVDSADSRHADPERDSSMGERDDHSPVAWVERQTTMKQQKRRAMAAQAAAQAFTVWPNQNMEALWSLCVFFELFIRDGGDATQAQFGPETEMGKVLRLVPKQSGDTQ